MAATTSSIKLKLLVGHKGTGKEIGGDGTAVVSPSSVMNRRAAEQHSHARVRPVEIVHRQRLFVSDAPDDKHQHILYPQVPPRYKQRRRIEASQSLPSNGLASSDVRKRLVAESPLDETVQ